MGMEDGGEEGNDTIMCLHYISLELKYFIFPLCISIMYKYLNILFLTLLLFLQRGKTALDRAREFRQTDIVKIIV